MDAAPPAKKARLHAPVAAQPAVAAHATSTGGSGTVSADTSYVATAGDAGSGALDEAAPPSLSALAAAAAAAGGRGSPHSHRSDEQPLQPMNSVLAQSLLSSLPFSAQEEALRDNSARSGAAAAVPTLITPFATPLSPAVMAVSLRPVVPSADASGAVSASQQHALASALSFMNKAAAATAAAGSAQPPLAAGRSPMLAGLVAPARKPSTGSAPPSAATLASLPAAPPSTLSATAAAVAAVGSKRPRGQSNALSGMAGPFGSFDLTSLPSGSPTMAGLGGGGAGATDRSAIVSSLMHAAPISPGLSGVSFDLNGAAGGGGGGSGAGGGGVGVGSGGASAGGGRGPSGSIDWIGSSYSASSSAALGLHAGGRGSPPGTSGFSPGLAFTTAPSSGLLAGHAGSAAASGLLGMVLPPPVGGQGVAGGSSSSMGSGVSSGFAAGPSPVVGPGASPPAVARIVSNESSASSGSVNAPGASHRSGGPAGAVKASLRSRLISDADPTGGSVLGGGLAGLLAPPGLPQGTHRGAGAAVTGHVPHTYHHRLSAAAQAALRGAGLVQSVSIDAAASPSSAAASPATPTDGAAATALSRRSAGASAAGTSASADTSLMSPNSLSSGDMAQGRAAGNAAASRMPGAAAGAATAPAVAGSRPHSVSIGMSGDFGPPAVGGGRERRGSVGGPTDRRGSISISGISSHLGLGMEMGLHGEGVGPSTASLGGSSGGGGGGGSGFGISADMDMAHHQLSAHLSPRDDDGSIGFNSRQAAGLIAAASRRSSIGGRHHSIGGDSVGSGQAGIGIGVMLTGNDGTGPGNDSMLLAGSRRASRAMSTAHSYMDDGNNETMPDIDPELMRQMRAGAGVDERGRPHGGSVTIADDGEMGDEGDDGGSDDDDDGGLQEALGGGDGSGAEGRASGRQRRAGPGGGARRRSARSSSRLQTRPRRRYADAEVEGQDDAQDVGSSAQNSDGDSESDAGLIHNLGGDADGELPIGDDDAADVWAPTTTRRAAKAASAGTAFRRGGRRGSSGRAAAAAAAAAAEAALEEAAALSTRRRGTGSTRRAPATGGTYANRVTRSHGPAGVDEIEAAGSRAEADGADLVAPPPAKRSRGGRGGRRPAAAADGSRTASEGTAEAAAPAGEGDDEAAAAGQAASTKRTSSGRRTGRRKVDADFTSSLVLQLDGDEERGTHVAEVGGGEDEAGAGGGGDDEEASGGEGADDGGEAWQGEDEGEGEDEDDDGDVDVETVRAPRGRAPARRGGHRGRGGGSAGAGAGSGAASGGGAGNSGNSGDADYDIAPGIESTFANMRLEHRGLVIVPHLTRLPDHIGAYTIDQRGARIQRFLHKRSERVWTRHVKYAVRKSFADSRLRVKGRFVPKDHEVLLREFMMLI